MLPGRRSGPRGPSVAHLLLLVPLVGLALGARLPIRDNSFLWHVRAGARQLDAGRVLTADPFSYSATGAPWRTQSWLPEVLYGLLERWTGGLGWVGAMLVVAGGLTLLLAGLAIHRETRAPLPTALVLFGLAWLSYPVVVPRPVVWSFPLLAALVLILQRWERLAWAAPLVLWVWSSVHGSFVLGLGLVVLEALRRGGRLWARVGLVGACVAAVSAGPHGTAVWGILAAFAEKREALDLLQEWAVPNPSDPSTWPYVGGIALLFLAAVSGRLSRRDLLVVVPFTFFGLTAQRALLPAALVLAPFAARGLSDLGSAGSVRGIRAAVHWALAGILVLGAAWSSTRPVGLDQESFPIEAARHLSGERTFHDVATGGYLIYATWPERQVLVDDRAELYGPELLRRVVASQGGGPAWRALFEEYGIEEALLREEHGLTEILEREGWSVTYRDATFRVLVAP